MDDVILVVAGFYHEFMRYRNEHREYNLRYVSGPSDFMGLSRDTLIIRIGSWNPRVGETCYELECRGYTLSLEGLPDAK